MRRLMWFTLGFTAACLLEVYGLFGEAIHGMAAFALPISLVLGLLGRKHRAALACAIILLGMGGGFFRYSIQEERYLQPLRELDGITETVEIRFSDYSRKTDYGIAVEGMLNRAGRDYPVTVYLESLEEIAPGNLVTGPFQLRMTAPGGAQESLYYSGKGIFLIARQEGELQIHPAQKLTVREKAARLCSRIKSILSETLEGDASIFARALLLGDTEDLSYEVDTRLKISGIRHVAAVSGLHVSILFSLVSMLTLKKRYLTALAGLPVLFLFAALAGFTPSVNRACIMSALMLLAMLLNREYDGATALSFAVLIMLIANPFSASSVSLQLSAASVAGIFCFSSPIRSWLLEKLGSPRGKGIAARLKHWLAGSASVSLSAMSLTTPLCAWYFGTVSLIGVVTNLLTLWLISLVFYGLMGLCALYLISVPAARILGKLISWMIRLILGTAGILSRFPLACIYTESVYVSLWLCFAYILLGVFLLNRKKRPKVLGLCTGLGLCLALVCSWAEPMLYDTVITVVDVGQGQCVLLQSQGKCYVVDCGGTSDSIAADAAAEVLLSRGISRIDGLILTHLDRDHAGGAENLLTRIPAQLLILPPVNHSLDSSDAAVIYADREVHLTWGSSTLRIFGEKSGESNNENSLCILLDTEKCDILITGDRNRDGEIRLLQSAQIPQVDVLVAGHHGSKNASSEELLQAVQPKIVCISVGKENIYGHPAWETLNRLSQFGCQIYRTDIHGTITVRR